jgi:hypothetical protein
MEANTFLLGDKRATRRKRRLDSNLLVNVPTLAGKSWLNGKFIQMIVQT